MHIEHLQFLLEVAKTKSITTAAKKLYISQTGLSAIISSIETELNIPIFRRTNKGTLLTPEGEKALELVKDILSKNDELHYLYSDYSRQHPIINLGIFPSGVFALSRYLTNIWYEQHRDAHLHIYEIGYENVQSCISSHTANVVIGAETTEYFNPEYTTKDGKTYVEPLYEDHFCVLVSSQSELASKESVALEDILDYHLLMTHNFPSPQEKPIGHVLHKFKRFTVLSGLAVAKQILVDNPNMVMIVPRISVYGDELLGAQRLKALSVTGFDTSLTIFMLCDACSSFSIQETLLIQEIRNFFNGLKSDSLQSSTPELH